MIAPHEIDTVITHLDRALESARAAKRIRTGLRDGDPTTRLRQSRSSALIAIRIIAGHIPSGKNRSGAPLNASAVDMESYE